jgi:hypothetical protein
VGLLSSKDMLNFMAKAGKWFHHDKIIPGPMIWPGEGRFEATHGKVGLGPLKTGKTTFSEGIIVRDKIRDLNSS